MKLERHFTPASLAALSFTGAAILYLLFAVSVVPDSLFPMPHSRAGLLALFLLGFLAPLSLGMWLQYGAAKALERGFSDELWQPAVIQRLRARLDESYFSWLTNIATGGGLACTFFLICRHGSFHHGPGGFVYFAASPVIALGGLRKALRPPRPRQIPQWKQDLKPIVSEHWGERGPTS